jgi:hypothetical protein
MRPVARSFSNVNELSDILRDRTIRTNVSNDILNVYLRPSTKIWAAIDSLMVTQLQSGEYEVFLFQITVSAAHPVAIRPKSLWNVIESFPSQLKNTHLNLVFVVPKQKAESYKIQRYLDNGKAAADISRISPRLTDVRPYVLSMDDETLFKDF